ncbi:MAG: thioredoxin domain-containing protein [Thermoleophilia bacterium]|nr:DsbA family protein [Gaiellaceae bacterium]MDW8338043.1 thioredoxin domain-containing protein [Thermoleophilia bacterium]
MTTARGRRTGFSTRAIVAAFAVAAALAVAVIGAALVLGGGSGGGARGPTTDLTGIAQEGAFLGNPEAKVLLIEYADLQCPFCREWAVEVFPTLVEEYVRPGDVRLELRGLAFLGPDSEKALRFVAAAGRQNRAWDLQEALFRAQGEENSGWVTDDLVRELASGIPGLDVDRMFADAESSSVTAQIREWARQGRRDGVPGTPTFFVRIDDEEPYLIQVPLEPDPFRAALDDALAG